MRVSLTPVQVAVDGVDEGFLVFLDERLVAVLTKLDEAMAPRPAAGFSKRDLAGLTAPTIRPSRIWTRPRNGSASAQVAHMKRNLQRPDKHLARAIPDSFS